MANIINVADLPTALQSAELIDTMVAAANAKASRVAPCLAWDGTVTNQPAPTEDQLAEARLVLIGMVKRWTETGAGALQSQTAGQFSMTIDTRQRTGYNPWPSEIEALQDVCSAGPVGRQAFSLDTAPTGDQHAPWCALNMGANYCDCGAIYSGYPLWSDPNGTAV